MATSNSTGAPAPTQHPFIYADDPEGTCHAIECVLTFVREYAQCHIGHEDEPLGPNHTVGMMYVLEGVQDAVKYLSHLDAVPTGNVTQIAGER